MEHAAEAMDEPLLHSRQSFEVGQKPSAQIETKLQQNTWVCRANVVNPGLQIRTSVPTVSCIANQSSFIIVATSVNEGFVVCCAVRFPVEGSRVGTICLPIPSVFAAGPLTLKWAVAPGVVSTLCSCLVVATPRMSGRLREAIW